MDSAVLSNFIINYLAPLLLQGGLEFGFGQLTMLLQKYTSPDEEQTNGRTLAEMLQAELENNPEFAVELVSALQEALRNPDTARVLNDRLGKAQVDQLINSLGLPIPKQLPPRIRNFTGRAAEMDELFAGLNRPPADDHIAIWIVAGMGGIGKSALAIEVAHSVKHLFADGQLYIDLRGGPENGPLEPTDVLAGFLRDLGVADACFPQTLQERSRMFRGKLDGKRLLLVLDNAHDVPQIKPLLPGSPGPVVLVTSRSPLAGLDNARRIELDVLSVANAGALLQRIVVKNHGRFNREPQSAARIIDLCGCLPLAIRIVGGALNTRSRWTLQEYADYLQEKIVEIGGPDSIQASFELSYRDLAEEEKLIFRYAALLPGADFSAAMAAGLMQAGEFQARDCVEALVEMQLLQANWGARYRYHDLVREFAMRKAAGDSAEDFHRCRKQIVDWYVEKTGARNATLQAFLHPQAKSAIVTPDQEAEIGGGSDLSETLEWLEAERLNILAALNWAVEMEDWTAASRLANDLSSFLNIRGYWSDWAAVLNSALTAAERLGDARAEADALTGLGRVYRLQGKAGEAEALLLKALDRRGMVGDEAGEARTILELGLTVQRQGRRAEAGEHFEKSLRVYRQIDDPTGEVMALNQLGNLRRLQGKWEKAAHLFEDSLAICERNGDKMGKAVAINFLANVYRLQGKWDIAIKSFRESLLINQALGNIYGETVAVGGLGNIYRGMGKWKDAVEMYQENLCLSDQLGDLRGRSITLNGLARVYNKMGKLDRAKEALDKSLTICEQLQLARGKSIGLRVLGELYAKQGDTDRAVSTIKDSMVIAKSLEDLRCQAQSLNSLGIVYGQCPENWELAEAAFEQALAIRKGKGDRPGQGQTKVHLGELYNHQGAEQKAAELWQEALCDLQEGTYDYRQAEKLLQRCDVVITP